MRIRCRSLWILAALSIAGSSHAQGVPDSISNIYMAVNAHVQSDSISLNGNGTDPLFHTLFAAHQETAQDGNGQIYGTTQIAARTRARVTQKSLAAYSGSTAGSGSRDTSYYGLGSIATTNASIRNYFRIDHPTLTGQPGTILASVIIDGAVFLNGDADALGIVQNRGKLDIWVTGLAPVYTCFLGSPLCHNQYSETGTTPTSEGGPVAGTHLLAIPFRFGDVGTIDMQIWTQGEATAVAYNGGANASSESNFLNEVRWGGISAVLDANGNPVANWSIVSAPGLDLTTPAPEPAAAMMLAAGATLLVGLGCRRGQMRELAATEQSS